MTHARQQPLPDWTLDATLGIFIHWGPYSVPAWAEPTGAWGAIPPEIWFRHNAYAEWYANTIRIEDSPAGAHHEKVHGGAPYDAFLDQWRAERYDPRAWAALFRSMGVDYVVPVTKHHDGVALWQAPGAEGFNTVERGPRRDLLGPLADAVRAEGMRFGVYYSGGLDWHRTDFPPIQSPEDVETLRPVDGDYAAYAAAHVRDLIDRYRPSVIWNDIEWPDAGKHDGSLDALIAHYREVVPDGVVNDRWGAEIWDYRTSEYSHDVHNEHGTGWEHNRGLGFSFGHNRIENEELTLSPRELARIYADVVSRGGRLLLNIGPEASGVIPDVQLRTLEGIAAWLTALKPRTLRRRALSAEEAAAIATTDGSWVRGWVSEGELVVIAERGESLPDRIADSGAHVYTLPR
ncbi:alpha-L-fucosidase [Microbacterium sp.]|uniref:alpha-L-fucosidase n=1 Tax=Microbacterium sp. TaxID=51671 RepID=UPI00281161AE|nr:alpha-L-fucosidase [Microbacterium sp.]